LATGKNGCTLLAESLDEADSVSFASWFAHQHNIVERALKKAILNRRNALFLADAGRYHPAAVNVDPLAEGRSFVGGVPIAEWRRVSNLQDFCLYQHPIHAPQRGALRKRPWLVAR
jgi:hypothetical protein